jgi:hypothetical protein
MFLASRQFSHLLAECGLIFFAYFSSLQSPSLMYTSTTRKRGTDVEAGNNDQTLLTSSTTGYNSNCVTKQNSPDPPEVKLLRRCEPCRQRLNPRNSDSFKFRGGGADSS